MKLFILFFTTMISSACYSGQTQFLELFRNKKHLAIPLKVTASIQEGEVQRGQGLYQALKSVGIENEMALKVINSLRDEVEFSKLRVGDKLQAKFDDAHNLISFMYSQNQAEKHIVTWNPNTLSWDYRLIEEDTHWKGRIISGQLRSGSTLQDDLLSKKLAPEVVNEIIQVLLCKVNFRMHARMGDYYEVLLNERFYDGDVIESKVLYTSYRGIKAGNHKAYYYEDSEKGSTYTAHYTEEGQALINAGLRYPLRRLHVRSNYGWRRHPVTGKKAMHRGVDLRGRTGDPVYAVAQGRVVLSTYNKYAGNKVAIKHRDGSRSYYFHLQKRGVKVGDWVKAHQIIGNVGSTGRVTGPHLHFGFKTARGRWMNPLNKRMIATPKLKGDHLENLTSQVISIKGLLADLKIKEQAPYLVASLISDNKKILLK